MVERKKYKNAEAVADGYHIVCPYAKCGHMLSIEPAVAKKGNVVECSNCRKGIRIRRVV